MNRSDHLGEFERATLLALVSLKDNAYGVSIRQELERRLERNVSIGAVYTTLDRLELKGLIASKIGSPTNERGGRAKKFFTIQSSAIQLLRNYVDASERLWRGVVLA